MSSIIESMSGRKLVYLTCTLLSLQVLSFFVGALISPSPNSSMQHLAIKCVDPEADVESDTWFEPRGSDACRSVDSLSSAEVEEERLRAEHIVFAFQLPLPRSKHVMHFSRWQQTLMGVLMMHVEYEKEVQRAPRVPLLMRARLGYRNEGDGQWKLLKEAYVDRNLDCDIDEDKKREGYLYNCSLLNLFELGSLHHNYYLLNIRLPSVHKEGGTKTKVNLDVGKLVDVYLIAIYQNGGFTKIWLALKAIYFPIIIIELVWYWRRIQMLPRDATLLEKMLGVLGLALTLLNVPLELFTLVFDMPWLIVFNDVKQGLFYASLMSFWLVFAGEHCINEENNRSNGFSNYYKKLSVVLVACMALLVFDMCERGAQLSNPFYSIWSTDAGTNLALAFIVLAGLAAGLFFLFLCFTIYRVLMTISEKQASISAMPRVRRLHYQGLIWRFRFLLAATIFTAAMTTVSFIIGQVSEGQYKWDESITMEYTSGFMTGVYSMWNIYIFGLIFLYAPSHKNWAGKTSGENDDSDLNVQSTGEEIEFSVLARQEGQDGSELSSLTQLMRHQAID